MSTTRSPAFPIHPALICGGAFFLLALSFQGRSRAEPPASPPETQTSGTIAETQPSSGSATDINVPNREAVEKAIERAYGYLQALLEDNQRRNKQDNWEADPAPVPGDPGFRGARWGELTGLALVAQLSGPRYDRRTFEISLETFMRASIDSPAALAMRLQLCEFWYPLLGFRTGAEAQRASAIADAALLLNRKDPIPDLAVSGDLPPALHWALRAGADIPDSYWQQTDAAWRKAQRPDGSWFDRDTDSPAVRVATTAKGITALLLARDAMPIGNADCKGRPPDTNLEAAFAWLNQHASDALAEPEAMFALASVGTTSGRRMFGTTNWYPRAVAALLKRQNADGSWPAAPRLTGAEPAAKLIPATAYAAMVLYSGLRFVGIVKLDYELPPSASGVATIHPADARPADVAHFADWADRELCGDSMTWERISSHAPPRDLSDASLVYISGSKPLAFSPDEEATLRAYALHGGLILGNADFGSTEFAESFFALGKRLFPDYTFGDLPSDHAIFTQETYKAKWKDPIKAVGISNGVRELMLLTPETDLGNAWQTARERSRSSAFQFGFDVMNYTVSRGWRDTVRGQPSWIERDASLKADRTIKVARLIYPGNADPEPGGWERLANLTHNGFHTDLDVSSVQVGSGKLRFANFRAAHLTGTGKLTLTDADRNEIVTFVKDGGTLIVDAAGGSKEFAESAAKELEAMFPASVVATGDLGTILDKQSDVYRLKGAGIEHFGCRRFAGGKIAGSFGVPRLQAIDIANRHAVFFSVLDLSNGLVGQETDGILGYDPGTASAIMRNLLLYAAGER
jgi:hypothetical protein